MKIKFNEPNLPKIKSRCLTWNWSEIKSKGLDPPLGPLWKRVPLRGPRGVQPLRIYLTLMIEIKSSMSADKIKGPIVIFTKAKKNSHAPQGLELLDLSWELPTGFIQLLNSQFLVINSPFQSNRYPLYSIIIAYKTPHFWVMYFIIFRVHNILIYIVYITCIDTLWQSKFTMDNPHFHSGKPSGMIVFFFTPSGDLRQKDEILHLPQTKNT